MKKYKVLSADLRSPFKGFQYELGKEYICPNFDTSDKTCSNGFYATDLDGLPYCYNTDRKVFEVEVYGKERIFSQYKQRFEKQVIIREVPLDEIYFECKKLDSSLGYSLSEVINPVNPFDIDAKLEEKHKQLLVEWASVRASFRDSVWASVMDSVGDSFMDSVGASVGASLRASVRASVRDLVRDLVWAYISSIFFSIDDWKYIDHERGVNPFQSGIDLWHDGFVPSFDGRVWRLHAGKDAKVVYEVKL